MIKDEWSRKIQVQFSVSETILDEIANELRLAEQKFPQHSYTGGILALQEEVGEVSQAFLEWRLHLNEPDYMRKARLRKEIVQAAVCAIRLLKYEDGNYKSDSRFIP